MRLRLSALLSALLLIGGCTSTSYDLLETASVSKPKFSDTDPQDFGVNNPVSYTHLTLPTTPYV